MGCYCAHLHFRINLLRKLGSAHSGLRIRDSTTADTRSSYITGTNVKLVRQLRGRPYDANIPCALSLRGLFPVRRGIFPDGRRLRARHARDEIKIVRGNLAGV